MTLKRYCFVLMTVLAFVFSTYGYVSPESGYTPVPADVIAYTYTDSYWDVVPNGNESSYFTDENNEVLPIYEDATLNFYGTVTSDYNPWAQTQCQWNQNMMLLDMTIEQLLMMNNFTSLGTTTMGLWNLTSRTESAFQFSADVGIDSCGPTMPQMPLEGVGGIIVDGLSGMSHSWYVWYATYPVGPVNLYHFRHTRRHSVENCIAMCQNIIRTNVIFVSPWFPGPNIDIILPFDKQGRCPSAWIYQQGNRMACYNNWNFPW